MVNFKAFDLFSLPFQFSMMGNDKQKRTQFGGFISLAIIILSITYFIYLCYLYFGNKMQPSISSTNQYFQDSFVVNLDTNLIAFKIILQNGMAIQDFESQQEKIYIQYLAFFTNDDDSGNTKYTPLNAMFCDDPDLSDYFCMDFSSVNPNGINQPFLTYYPENIQKQKIQIMLIYCTDDFLQPGQVCASPAEIRENVIRLNTKIYAKITMKQYDPSTKSYQKKVRQESFYFTESLVFLGKFSLQKTSTTISTGFIIQNSTSDTYISDYIKFDQYSTNAFVLAETNMNMLGVCYFFISENGLTHYIQFPQFTSLLAQFSSVFNTLLIVGVICKMIAQSEIVQDFVEIQLKLYYKKSALDLISKVNCEQDKSQSYKDSADLYNMYKKILNMDYRYYINKYLNLSFFQRIKLFFFQDGIDKIDKNDTKEVRLYKKLMNSTSNSINIFDIQKEILKIKMMLRMIFTVEQYAALQLCGLKINIDDEGEQDQRIHTSDIKDQNEKCEQINNKNENNKFVENNQLTSKEDSYKSPGLTPNQTPKYMNGDSSANKNLKYDEVEQKDIELAVVCNKLDSYQALQNHLEKIDYLESNSKYFEKCLISFLDKNEIKSQLDQRILNCMIGFPEMKELQQLDNNNQNEIFDKDK